MYKCCYILSSEFPGGNECIQWEALAELTNSHLEERLRRPITKTLRPYRLGVNGPKTGHF